MGLVIALLEDDEPRTRAMQEQLALIAPSADCHFFDNAPDMIAWLGDNLRLVDLLCLDHDLGANQERNGKVFDPGTGRDVVDFLCGCRPSCPVIIHSSNAPAADGMRFALQDAGWEYKRVVPFEDLTWIKTSWHQEMVALLSRLEGGPDS